VDHAKVPRSGTKPWHQPCPVTSLASKAGFRPMVQSQVHSRARNELPLSASHPTLLTPGWDVPQPSPAHRSGGPREPPPVPRLHQRDRNEEPGGKPVPSPFRSQRM